MHYIAKHSARLGEEDKLMLQTIYGYTKDQRKAEATLCTYNRASLLFYDYHRRSHRKFYQQQL